MINPAKRRDSACIRGLSITVYDVLGSLDVGMSKVELLADFSDLPIPPRQEIDRDNATTVHQSRPQMIEGTVEEDGEETREWLLMWEPRVARWLALLDPRHRQADWFRRGVRGINPVR